MSFGGVSRLGVPWRLLDPAAETPSNSLASGHEGTAHSLEASVGRGLASAAAGPAEGSGLVGWSAHLGWKKMNKMDDEEIGAMHYQNAHGDWIDASDPGAGCASAEAASEGAAMDGLGGEVIGSQYPGIVLMPGGVPES